jgi:aspartate/methionine/tyrosine aminotransferase
MTALKRDFALEVHFSQWEFTAKYNLTASDAESLSIRDLLSLATEEDRDAFLRLHLGYTETYGAPSLRAAIADTYATLSAADILCLAGAGEGIYLSSRVLLEPEDHAIVITPNYQSAETVPLSICEVSGAALDADNGWRLDLERVRDALRPNTRLISINFPNNPTGVIPPVEVQNELVDLCRQHDTWLFSDEVYRLIERDPELRIPQVADVYEKGISLNVMSKAYGLPGLRIGWLSCKDHDFLQRCERYKHFLSICNSAPSEALAEIALKHREEILSRTRALVKQNASIVMETLSRYPHLFEFSEPDGGCVCFVRYRGEEGVEEFTRRLVTEAGILLLPSSIYRSDVGDVPDDFFRIGIGRAFVPEAMAAMQVWLEQNQPLR